MYHVESHVEVSQAFGTVFPAAAWPDAKVRSRYMRANECEDQQANRNGVTKLQSVARRGAFQIIEQAARGTTKSTIPHRKDGGNSQSRERECH